LSSFAHRQTNRQVKQTSFVWW